MLSVEENKVLTRTGPGTPMGNLMRRYWIPALESSDLPKPDCPPVRVRLLSENLVAFRDSNGTVALFDEHCPHRRASLFFGRNEECGLRCVYHGWKFDASGQCVDMPSEPAESNFKDNVKIKSYPCQEYGGIIWTYMGPPEHKPELPPFQFGLLPESHRSVSRFLNEANYFQGIESAIDSSHISFLHRRKNDTPSKMQRVTHKFGNPRFEVIKTDYGMLIGARRQTEDPNTVYWRVTQYIMPWYQMIPPITLEVSKANDVSLNCWIPVDDETTMNWKIVWDPLYPLQGPNARNSRDNNSIPKDANHLQLANKRNDYMIDRELQASGKTFTGMPNIPVEDQAMTESQGAIANRSKERLGTSDTAIIVARRILLDAAKKLEKGETPPGLDPDKINVQPVSILLSADVPLMEGVQEYLVPEAVKL